MPFLAVKASTVAEPNAPAESAEEIETTGPAAANAAVTTPS
jgi:hypothetical protein